MSVFTSGLITALKGDATLTTLMGTYRTEPAWFSIFPTPGDAGRPLGVVRPQSDPSRGLEFDAKDIDSRNITYSVDVFTDADGSIVDLEAIAERVKALFHRTPSALTITGYDVIDAFADGPTELPTDHTVYGRRVSVEMILTKQ